jgi:O-antigen/teichoic acid export membrane protein
LFLNYFFGLVFSTYSISTFVVNKIYLTSLRSLESNILRILLLFLFYYFLPPFAFYIVLVAFIVNLYTIFFNIYYKKKFLPDLVFNTKFFDLKSIIEVSKSGFWNVLVRLGQLLIDGFDLFISNWFLGPLLMGVIALSKTIPTTILSLVGFVGYAFVPDLTYLYAHSKITEFKNEIKKSIKIMGFIINIPLALLFLFGKEFYFLWLATSESETIYILTSITLIPLIFSGSLNSLYNVFTITNKLMINAVSVIFSGLLGFIISILLLSFTDLGIYSIVIASSLVSTLRILLITIPFGAKFLGLKWNTFYSDLIKSITFLLTALFIGFFVRIFIIPSDWYRLALSVSLTTIISMFFNFFVFLSKTERHSIERIFLNKKGL